MSRNVFLAGALLFATLLLFKDPGPSQAQKSVRWEYCVINTTYIPLTPGNQGVVSAIANVCYIQPNGCRNEEVRSEVNFSKILQDYRLENDNSSLLIARDRAMEAAFASAVAKLGADGWEMITEPKVQFNAIIPNGQGSYIFETGTKDLEPQIYFKRARQ